MKPSINREIIGVLEAISVIAKPREGEDPCWICVAIRVRSVSFLGKEADEADHEKTRGKQKSKIGHQHLLRALEP